MMSDLEVRKISPLVFVHNGVLFYVSLWGLWEENKKVTYLTGMPCDDSQSYTLQSLSNATLF